MVRSYGMATYRNPQAPHGYDEQTFKYLREGKINTIFIDPGSLGADYGVGFDAAPFLDSLKKHFPNVVVALYTWDNCRKIFMAKHPRFKHYFSIFISSFFLRL